MTPGLEKLLCSRYPLIFPEGKLPRRSSLGNGWFGVLDALCESLQAATARGGPQVVAEQVSESFGVLHFDPHLHVNAEQKGMIDQAIAMSAKICEICGAPALLIAIRRGGCRTRCAVHEGHRADAPIPVAYVYVDSETGQMTGQVVQHGVCGALLPDLKLSGIMGRARWEGTRDAQVVQLRDLAELPMRSDAK